MKKTKEKEKKRLSKLEGFLYGFGTGAVVDAGTAIIRQKSTMGWPIAAGAAGGFGAVLARDSLEKKAAVKMKIRADIDPRDFSKINEMAKELAKSEKWKGFTGRVFASGGDLFDQRTFAEKHPKMISSLYKDLSREAASYQKVKEIPNKVNNHKLFKPTFDRNKKLI